MKIFSLLTCLLIANTFESCSKKEGSATTQPTKTDNISTGTWKYDSGGIDQDRNGTIDIPLPSSILEPCKIDNTLKFDKGGTGVTNEGASKCLSTDPQTTTFNWNFADAEANLVISGNVYALLNSKFKIVTLNSTTFSLSRDTVLSGQTLPLLVNLKH
jgi:hypothetical protein